MSQDDFAADGLRERIGDEAYLPPVKPPSAGFLVQLFVVPALIVLAVVGVWALFGKIASSEEDWRELVEDVRNSNEHRRWRGAYGLAMLLNRDQQLADSGQHLASNQEIARVLVKLFEEELPRHSKEDDGLKEFLARALGLLDSPATVLPALAHGMQPDQGREVRKNSLASIAMIADRGVRQEHAVDSPSLVDNLIEATLDSDPLIRDLGTYALGFFSTPAARDRLTILLTHGDRNTRANAANALARQKSTAGFTVFKEILVAASSASADLKPARPDEVLLAVRNTLAAVRTLATEWTPAQTSELIALVEPISKNDALPRIRTDAIDVLVTLRKAPATKSPKHE